MNKKIILIIGMILLVLPMILAEEVGDIEAFDLFYLFVENTFGNMWVAGFGIAGLLFLICILGKMSNVSALFLVGIFAIAYFIGMIGALAAVPAFLAAFIYFTYSTLNFINSFR